MRSNFSKNEHKSERNNKKVTSNEQKTLMKEACREIILDREGRVLLTKRAEGIGKDQYSLVGGKVDANESAEAAISREVREEIGIEFVPLFYSENVNTNTDPADPWQTTYFTTGEIAGNIKPDPTEVEEIIFASEEDLDKLDIAFDHKDRLKEFFQSRKTI